MSTETAFMSFVVIPMMIGGFVILLNAIKELRSSIDTQTTILRKTIREEVPARKVKE